GAEGSRIVLDVVEGQEVEQEKLRPLALEQPLGIARSPLVVLDLESARIRGEVPLHLGQEAWRGDSAQQLLVIGRASAPELGNVPREPRAHGGRPLNG